MQNKLFTITIGIPAYNEGANIETLLRSLLAQNRTHYELEKIIVVSDASNDNTISKIKSVNSKKVELKIGKKRIGQALRQNQIFESSKSDIVVLLNGDVLPKNARFLDEIIKPFYSKPNLGLVGAKVNANYSPTKFGQMLDWHMNWKNKLFQTINHADNLYLCHGRARAFSRKLYTKLRWPKIWSEDAFSYLACKKFGFDFFYARKSIVLFQSPQTFVDHKRQSVRFLKNKTSLTQHIDYQFLHDELIIPTKLILKHTIMGWFTKPHFMSWYLLVYTVCLLESKFDAVAKLTVKPDWEPSISTKKITFRT